MKYRLGHIRQVSIWISPVRTSWKSESSNISLVVFDKLIFGLLNLFFEKLTKYDRQTCRWTDGHMEGQMDIYTDRQTGRTF